VTSVFGLDPDALKAFCIDRGAPAYVADQVLDWVYRKHVTDPQEMTNISQRDRAMLAASLTFCESTVCAEQTASDGTLKLLLGWEEPSERGGTRQTECVAIPNERRLTACISSQVGCPVGCAFCASGIGGLEGNLSTGRIVEQVHRLSALPAVGRVTNIVFMGMGEPLANLQAVTQAIRTLNAPWGFGIGARRITVSTVGLPAAIRRLVDFELPVTLALSLHAPNDALRKQLIPWAEYASIAELIDACDAYFRATGREITLEYILLGGVNDRPEHARELVEVAGRLRANVNLIRYNEVRGLPFTRPRTEDVHAFQRILRTGRVNAHIRASRGRDIAAACGQLRHERGNDVELRTPG
jgi:23S rRNA (adenine2503-C2)-methyltransferase